MDYEIKGELLERIKRDLGQNFKDGDEKILRDSIDLYSSIATDKSNRKITDKKILPYIYIAVKEAYLRRGDEGTSNSSEGSISSSYIDIEEKLAHDIRSIRIVR